MRPVRLRHFGLFIIFASILFASCPISVSAQTTIDHLFVTEGRPLETVDGVHGKEWSVTEKNCLELGKTFYFAFDGVSIDSDCNLYAVIIDPNGTEYTSTKRSIFIDPDSLLGELLPIDYNMEIVKEYWEEGEGLDVHGYHWRKFSTYMPSGLYTGTLYVGDQQKSVSWYMVDTPIEIWSGPKDVSVKVNESATFYVDASGSNLTYQWYYNDRNSTLGGYEIKGADGPSYTISNVDASLDGMYFYCAVSNYSDTEKYDVITKQTTPARLTVNRLDPLVSAVESREIYDGKSHMARILVTGPDDYTIYYSTSVKLNQFNYTTGSTLCPSRTDVGTTTVYYYVHDNRYDYKDYAGTTNITILDSTVSAGSSQPATQPAAKKEETAVKKPELSQKGHLTYAKSPKKGVIKLKWKKISKITGYQFFVSKDKSFTSHTLKKTYKKKVTSVVIRKWPSKKIFYMKMRP
ncbi:MAG: immunoglobulin domain-containing protein, partial [Eubacterium sp.]|nr:immunoglobulin domain-containing protein [Eubacterium sp.]